ncbi:hypothetical protein K440DRAFT_658993 [Wilcoxina mikolae CBS 423.85]|nr:hypothetical protein K440DRAFT_658993 [Wilcoxina mikolae CBS 423.85]
MEQIASSTVNQQTVQQFKADVSSEHKADISGEEHERSRSEASSLVLSATSFTNTQLEDNGQSSSDNHDQGSLGRGNIESESAHTTSPIPEDTIVPPGDSKYPTVQRMTDEMLLRPVQPPAMTEVHIGRIGPNPHRASLLQEHHRHGMGACNNAKTYGPRPTGTITGVIEELDNQIKLCFRDFRNHSMECRACRNPVLAYQEGGDLCSTGRALSVNITKLLYKKAENVPQGKFTVEYKPGWEAVDGLVRIICHYNQGSFTNQIMDVKRFPKVLLPPAIEAPAPIYRGRQYEEYLIRRRQQTAERNGLRRSPQRTNSTLEVYGEPRTSYLDFSSGRTQADISPPSSSRSIHFDSYIRVREFEKGV